MTIQEAIKSDKPFRRKSVINTDGYWYVMTDLGELVNLFNGELSKLTKNSLIDGDWEIKQ